MLSVKSTGLLKGSVPRSVLQLTVYSRPKAHIQKKILLDIHDFVADLGRLTRESILFKTKGTYPYHDECDVTDDGASLADVACNYNHRLI